MDGSRFLDLIGFDAVLSYGFARRDISAWSLLPSTTNRLFVSKYIPMYWYIGTYSYNIYILHEGIGVYFSRISVCCHKKNRANDISLPFTPSYTKLPVRCFSLPPYIKVTSYKHHTHNIFAGPTDNNIILPYRTYRYIFYGMHTSLFVANITSRSSNYLYLLLHKYINDGSLHGKNQTIGVESRNGGTNDTGHDEWIFG